MNRSHILAALRGRRLVTIAGIALAAAIGSVIAVRARAAGIPSPAPLLYTGYLETPTGEPMTEPAMVSISVWDAVTAGNKVCATAVVEVTPLAGRFQLQLPDPCTEAVGAKPNLWLEPTVNGTKLSRSKLSATPYSVEANHAAVADAASPTGTLATQAAAVQADIAALKADIATLKARLDAPLGAGLSKYSGAKVTLSSLEYVWLSGTDAATLAPGRYWVFNTARAWALPEGCAGACQVATVFFAPCMRVAGKLTASASQVVLETPVSDSGGGELGMSLPAPAIDFFDIAKSTADVQLGLCARRSATPATYNAAIADMFTAVMPQPK